MVNGNTPKNLQELYKFYNHNNPFYPNFTGIHSMTNPQVPPKVYLNPVIMSLSIKLDLSIYNILEYIQRGDFNGIRGDERGAEIDKYFDRNLAAGGVSNCKRVFKKINEAHLKLKWTIDKPVNQLLNQYSKYDFRKIENQNSYYFYEKRGGWSYSPGIFILKYGKEQPSFLNWREPPF